MLIIGVRQHRTLAYKGEIYDLAATRGHRVQICVALSQPDAADLPVLQSGGVEAYDGRVDDYISQCSFGNMKAAFLCGSPLLALNVTKSKAFRGLRQCDGVDMDQGFHPSSHRVCLLFECQFLQGIRIPWRRV